MLIALSTRLNNSHFLDITLFVLCGLFQAKSRVKLNFLENLAKFWELQVSANSFS